MNKKDFLIALGNKIQKVRKAKGLTQVDLVGKIEGEIDTTNISRIEKGRTNPTATTLLRIANALEIEVKDFFTFDED